MIAAWALAVTVGMPAGPRVVGAGGAHAAAAPVGPRTGTAPGGLPKAEREQPRGFKIKVHRFLPVPSVRVEPAIGLTAGLRARYVYRPEGQAFDRVRLDVVGLVSTRLVQDHSVALRLRDLFHREEIFDVGFRFVDDPVFPFVGIAADEVRDSDDLDDDFYRLDLRSIGGGATYQQPFAVVEAGRFGLRTPGFARWFIGARFSWDRQQPDLVSLYADEVSPRETRVRRGSMLGGIAWDSRDNGWSPKRGSLHDVSLELGGPWLASNQTWARLNASTRFYRPLGTDKVVLANQFIADFILGDAPLVPLGELGGLYPLEGIGGRDAGRGFYRRRFIGRRKLYASAEIRAEPWEFRIWRWYVAPGVKIFTDVGSAAEPPRLWSQRPHLSGGGGVYLVWDRFFVMRFDAGVSEEGYGLYVTANHAF